MSQPAIIQRSTALWQQQLQDCVESIEELCSLLQLAPASLDLPDKSLALWPMRVPRAYVQRIKPGDINDPLLKQILPVASELQDAVSYIADPLQEQQQSPAAGLIHKYKGRVLLVTTGACAIHCRYCFRREFDYQHHRLSRAEWQHSLQYIRDNDDIQEVILSGGDPLILGDAQLAWLLEELAAIEHVQRLRIHTRTPIVLPARVSQDLLSALSATRLPCVIVVHCNHAAEVDDDVRSAMQALRQHCHMLLNQSVMLAGVNDGAEAVVALSYALFDAGITPYYMHLLDKVCGSAHFHVPMVKAQAIFAAAAAQLPGYLVPRLVQETAGLAAKELIPISLR